MFIAVLLLLGVILGVQGYFSGVVSMSRGGPVASKLLSKTVSGAFIGNSMRPSPLSHGKGRHSLLSAPLAAAPPRFSKSALHAAATEEAANPRNVGLALELDDGTRKVHSVAENTQFVAGFFKGLGQRESFAQLTASFYFVYEAMERALDTLDCAALKALDFKELRRLEGLERDMAFFYGAEWRSKIKPSRATAEYVRQIESVAGSEEPELLVGHLYSRYLGDLFGGQMMSGMALKTLGDAVGDGDGGLAFYEFSEIADSKAFITEWYSTLNELDLSPAMREKIVEEANVVFRLNIDVFNELEGSAISSALRLALETLKEKLFG